MGKKITDVKSDKNGVNTAYLFEGNKTYTPKETALNMAKNGQIDNAVYVNAETPHIRSKPDGNKRNNHDTMTGDK